MGRARVTRRAYGSGCVYEKRPGRWYFAVPVDGKRRHQGSFPSRAAAELALAEVTAGVRGWPDGSVPALAWHGDRWVARRKTTHLAAAFDASRWTRHVRPALGHLRPAEVDAAALRRMVEAKLAEGLAPQTVAHLVRLVSTMFADLCERPRETGVKANPVRSLPRAVRRLYRPAKRETPWLDGPDCHRVARELPRPLRALYLTAWLAMLRTGEVLALAAEDVDLARGRIAVRSQVQGGKLRAPKDADARVVPIQSALRPVLAALLNRTPTGPLFLAERPRRGRRPFQRPRTLHLALRSALERAGLPRVTWYAATRHSGAAAWVASGGSVEALALILGHSSTEVTRRYAHLRPGVWQDADFQRIGSRRVPNRKPGRGKRGTGALAQW